MITKYNKLLPFLAIIFMLTRQINKNINKLKSKK